MDDKCSYNILITDLTKLEWLASKFIWECHIHSNLKPLGQKKIKWIKPPKWINESSRQMSMNFYRYEIEEIEFNLYNFPTDIYRNFLLRDLSLKFDGVLLIVDLGSKQFWENLISVAENSKTKTEQSQSSKSLMIRDPDQITKKESKAILIQHMSAFGDPRRIWGVELVNQVAGTKLILAINSTLDSFPTSYINKYLHIESSFDILEYSVDPNMWSELSPKFTDKIIQDILMTFGQKLNK